MLLLMTMMTMCGCAVAGFRLHGSRGRSTCTQVGTHSRWETCSQLHDGQSAHKASQSTAAHRVSCQQSLTQKWAVTNVRSRHNVDGRWRRSGDRAPVGVLAQAPMGVLRQFFYTYDSHCCLQFRMIVLNMREAESACYNYGRRWGGECIDSPHPPRTLPSLPSSNILS